MTTTGMRVRNAKMLGNYVRLLKDGDSEMLLGEGAELRNLFIISFPRGWRDRLRICWFALTAKRPGLE